MALDILILSILRAAPVHGYELKQRVQRPTLTRLSNNSLYPYLRRFEAAGAVTSSLEQQDGKPSKRIYAITDAGRSLFSELVSTLPPDLAASDEEFLVRLSFFGEIDAAARKSILAARTEFVDARLGQVRALMAGSAALPEWRALAMDHLIEQLERERTWLAALAEKAGTELHVPTGSN